MSIFDSLKGLFSGGKGANRTDIAKRFDIRGGSGQGSMSKLHHAFDKKSGRTVCLKILDKQKTKFFEEKFKSQGLKKPPEGEICLSLNHPNIVRTYEHGITTDGSPYIVMEWVDGQGLNFHIESGGRELAGKRVSILCQLCDALAYLHREKYLHRDLCPRNIMLTRDGTLKLIDFGLTIPNTPEFCRPGNRTGTPDILAPEIIKRQTTDLRVDIFALGVTAFEVFCGKLPWEKGASSEETFRRHLNEPPRRPNELNPDLDADVVELLMRSIDTDKMRRPANAAMFKKALEELDRLDY